MHGMMMGGGMMWGMGLAGLLIVLLLILGVAASSNTCPLGPEVRAAPAVQECGAFLVFLVVPMFGLFSSIADPSGQISNRSSC